MPAAVEVARAIGRSIRLRCPDCGKGRVLTRWGMVRDRCSACGLRYERTDDNYFAGAVFFGILMGEGIFALTLLIVVLVSWPHVPWNALQYAPVGMAILAPLLLPLSKLAWLSIDVLVRPVVAEERLQPQA